MNETMHGSDDDPLARALSRVGAEGITQDATALRERLLQSTTGVIRRRRRVRRVVTALAMAGCYLAGIATWHFAQDNLVAANRRDGQAVTKGSLDDHPATIEESVKTGDDESAVAGPTMKPRKREPESRFAALCTLGDRNLLERRDPEAATRAYRMALRHATADERSHAATDGTWLLKAINLSYQPEAVHASSTTDRS